MRTSADMPVYTVQAKRWEHGWELHIQGVGVTQSRGLKDAEMMARDLISRRMEMPEDSFAVEIVPEVGGGLDEETKAARQAVAEADSAQRAAASQSREVARKLSLAGLSGRDIALVLRVSPQRVSQLLRSPVTDPKAASILIHRGHEQAIESAALERPGGARAEDTSVAVSLSAQHMARSPATAGNAAETSARREHGRNMSVARNGLEGLHGHSDRQTPIQTLGDPAAVLASGQVCAMIAVDIAGFTRPDRDEDIRIHLRKSLSEILHDAFAGSGIPWEQCHHTDRGDGALIIVPPSIPARGIIDRLPEVLGRVIRRHNRMYSEVARMQLRAAAHIGPVYYDDHGLAGDDIRLLDRILEATPLRKALTDTSAELALAVSGYMYDSLVSPHPSLIDPALFQPIRTRVERAAISAWMYAA